LGLPGAAARTAKAPKAESKPAPAVQTKRLSAASLGSKKMQVEVTPQQQADNDYGKAVRLLEAGRRAEAMAVLESVLMKHYKHAPARQMLAGLLVAEQRPYEAMNLLKAGLRVDSSQTDMAMLLARLQVEKGENGAALLTLQQSLTYGRVKPDYQAFIAAIYQREKRHQEAIEHYRAALGERPGHGVWWMGYGISLQAVGRAVDARTAFGQARDSGSLSPQLKTFVEQRLVELSQ
jgi:MSHA biogenesis protein MshN